MTDPIDVTVYFDYLCPFAYRGVRLLTDMEQRPEVNVTWRHFPLEQINAGRYDKGEGWKLWEQPLDYEPLYKKRRARALPAFLASHAASLQGADAFARFRLAVFAAYHDDKHDISDPDVLLALAGQANLDLAKFQAHWQSQAGRDRLRDDYLLGQEAGAFGVPTLVIDACEATYMRLSEYPATESERKTFFDELVHMLTQRPFLQEIKRASAA